MPDSATSTRSILVDIVTGTLLHAEGLNAEGSHLPAFAEISPDIFASINISWDTIFAVLDTPKSSLEFQDLVLVGQESIFIAQRIASDPSLALLSVTPAEKGIGLALSEARGQILELLAKE